MAPSITDEDGARGEGQGGIVKPSTSHTIEDLEAKVEEIAQELSGLESRHQDATSQIRHAEQKFAQLEAQRNEVAPRAFAGDEKARVDLDSVELEQAELARSSRVAQAAVPGLKHMVAEAKERLARAQEQVHKARAQAAYEELKGVEARRDELAGELREVFEVHSRVHGRYQEAVRPYDQDQANDMAGSRGAVYQSWIKKAFARWF
jgi:chromosome segregation ATPase